MNEPVRVTVVCQTCGHRHTLERLFAFPGPVRLICHFCEVRIGTEVTAAQLSEVRRSLRHERSRWPMAARFGR